MLSFRDGPGVPASVRREDYAPPAFWIDSVELCFDLDPARTRVLNRMTVRRLWSEQATYDTAQADAGPLQEALHGVLEYAVLASHRRAFDPMETAIGEAGTRLLAGYRFQRIGLSSLCMFDFLSTSSIL